MPSYLRTGFRSYVRGFDAITATSLTTTGALVAGTTVTAGTGITATTGNVQCTAGQFLGLAGATPAYSYIGSTNYGHGMNANVLNAIIAGTAKFTLTSALATTDTNVSMQVGGRLQSYNLYTADVVAQLNNLDPGSAMFLQLNPTAARSWTGMVFAGNGDFKIAFNTAAAGSGFNLTLEHDHTDSTEVNRFFGLGGADVVVPPQGAVLLMASAVASRWRAVPLF